MAINEEFPILEYLIVDPWAKDIALMLPETSTKSMFPRADRLHLSHTTVALWLTINYPPAYFQPNILLQ